jgi:tripartite-type tricarboxylate transporter receptor subunit TctC
MEIKPVRTKAELVAAWESRLHPVPEAFAAHIAAEIARWGEVVKRAGMEAQ